MKPLHLEVIAPTLQGLGLCTACELVLAEAGVAETPAGRSFDEYPQEWQDDCRRLSDWVFDLANQYGDQIRIRVVDPQSPEGLVKSLRYRIRRYPTFVIEGKTRIVGWERERLDAALAEVMHHGSH